MRDTLIDLLVAAGVLAIVFLIAYGCYTSGYQSGYMDAVTR